MSLSQKHSEIQINNSQFQNDPNEKSLGDWLIGCFSLWVGIIAVFLVFLASSIPLVVATVLAHRIFGSEQFEPVITIWFLYSPVWFWFALRFFFPAFFDLVKLSGIFWQKLAFVRPFDALNVVKQRAMDLVYDLKLWTVWFHGKN